MHMAELPIPEPGACGVEMVAWSWKHINSCLRFWQNWPKWKVKNFFEIHILTNSGVRMSCLSMGRSLLLCVCIRMVIKLIVAILKAKHC
jgi:lipoprotein signal peptidase